MTKLLNKATLLVREGVLKKTSALTFSLLISRAVLLIHLLKIYWSSRRTALARATVSSSSEVVTSLARKDNNHTKHHNRHSITCSWRPHPPQSPLLVFSHFPRNLISTLRCFPRLLCFMISGSQMNYGLLSSTTCVTPRIWPTSLGPVGNSTTWPLPSYSGRCIGDPQQVL